MTTNLKLEEKMSKPVTIKIDEIEYVRVDSIKKEEIDGEYCLIRTYSAGVFLGIVKERQGKEGTIKNARRIWQWSGASSLSQLSVDGTKNPNGCKFPCEVDEVVLTEIIEILPCTKKAVKSLKGVKVWEQ